MVSLGAVMDEKRYGELLAEHRPRLIETPDEHERLLTLAESLMEKGDNLSPEEEHLLALTEAAAHRRSPRWTGTAPLARSARRQNAQTSFGVGAPQRSHGRRCSRSSADADAKRSDARARNPK